MASLTGGRRQVVKVASLTAASTVKESAVSSGEARSAVSADDFAGVAAVLARNAGWIYSIVVYISGGAGTVPSHHCRSSRGAA